MLFSKKICVTLLAAVIAASSAFAVSAANEQEVGANSAANVDVTATIEATNKSETNNALLNLLEEYGIIEIARTGIAGLQRGERHLALDDREHEEN